MRKQRKHRKQTWKQTKLMKLRKSKTMKTANKKSPASQPATSQPANQCFHIAGNLSAPCCCLGTRFPSPLNKREYPTPPTARRTDGRKRWTNETTHTRSNPEGRYERTHDPAIQTPKHPPLNQQMSKRVTKQQAKFATSLPSIFCQAGLITQRGNGVVNLCKCMFYYGQYTTNQPIGQHLKPPCEHEPSIQIYPVLL